MESSNYLKNKQSTTGMNEWMNQWFEIIALGKKGVIWKWNTESIYEFEIGTHELKTYPNKESVCSYCTAYKTSSWENSEWYVQY